MQADRNFKECKGRGIMNGKLKKHERVLDGE
jgi:hypothetical protein